MGSGVNFEPSSNSSISPKRFTLKTGAACPRTARMTAHFLNICADVNADNPALLCNLGALEEAEAGDWEVQP